MDKLIRFINEYGHTSSCWPFETYRIEPATDWISSYLVLSRDDNWEWDWKDWHLPVPRLISKEYGFIKRLVENDKIDLWKIKKLYRKSNENSTHTYPILYDYSYDESLLMFLAIQDEPISFLISILK